MARRRRLVAATGELHTVASMKELREHILAHLLLGRDPTRDDNGHQITVALCVHQWFEDVIPTWGRQLTDGELLASLRYFRQVYEAPLGPCSMRLWKREAGLVFGGLNIARRHDHSHAPVAGALIEQVLGTQTALDVRTPKEKHMDEILADMRNETLRRARSRGVDLHVALNEIARLDGDVSGSSSRTRDEL